MLNRNAKKMMSSNLRHRVNIKSKIEVADGQGGFNQTWATAQTVWASVEPVQEAQSEYYRSVNADTTHIIRIRGNITILDTYEIEFEDRKFEILAFADYQEIGIVKTILCKEVKRK